MDDRTFIAPDGSTVFFFSPPNPEFEAISSAEVADRVRAALPGLPDAANHELSDAVMLWVPVPDALGEYLNKAIFGLQGMFDFLQTSDATEHSFWNWRQLKNEVFETIGALHHLRDAVGRVCDHEILEPAPEHDRENRVLMRTAAAQGWPVPEWEGGSRRCTTCGTGWGPGKERPPRIVLARAYSSMFAARQRPGRGAFLYFSTELLRRHGLKKFEAMRAGSTLIDLFWNDDDSPYTDLQLEEVHRRGKDSSDKTHLITAKEFAEIPVPIRRHSAATRLIWMRVHAANPAGSGR